MLERQTNAIDVGTGLIAGLVVIDPAHQVRILDNLQTTVFFRRSINGDETACHVWKQTTVRVPVTIVLMPLPRTADKRLFQHHLVVIMVYLSPQELFER